MSVFGSLWRIVVVFWGGGYAWTSFFFSESIVVQITTVDEKIRFDT